MCSNDLSPSSREAIAYTDQAVDRLSQVTTPIVGSFTAYLVLVAILGLSPQASAIVVLFTMWGLSLSRYVKRRKAQGP